MPHVFVGKFLRRCERERLLLVDRLTRLHGLAQVIDRVGRVNGGGPRVFESRGNRFQMSQKACQATSTEGARALREAVSGGGANRAGAANDHVFNGPRCLAEVARPDYPEFVGQETLLDEQDCIVPGVKSHGPEMARAAVEGDVQTISTLIFRILLSMFR